MIRPAGSAARSLAAAVLAAAALAPAPGRAADGPAVSGYVRETPLAWNSPAAPGTGAAPARWIGMNLLHTREELRAHPSPALTLALDLKTRLFTGGGSGALLDQADLYAGRRTYFDWQRRFVDERSAVLVSTLDRAWLDVQAGRAQLTLGRQRIAWGTGLVWNPIDIFNPSSPLDFDDEEKPGTDAGRVQVYLGPSSKLELAVAPARRADDAVAAAQVLVNRAGYDWIALGGRRGPDAVLGLAWAGSLGGAGFRGEALVARPRTGSGQSAPAGAAESNVCAGLDGDYTFASTLYLHGGLLYNERGSAGRAGGARLVEAYERQWLSPARVSIYAEAARTLNPLVRLGLSTILDPDDGSWYAGPLLTWSVVTDLDATATGLVFGGASGTEFGDQGTLLMGRLKWSF